MCFPIRITYANIINVTITFAIFSEHCVYSNCYISLINILSHRHVCCILNFTNFRQHNFCVDTPHVNYLVHVSAFRPSSGMHIHRYYIALQYIKQKHQIYSL
jgi:hypothetical protein